MNPKKELLWGLWVKLMGGQGFEFEGFRLGI